MSKTRRITIAALNIALHAPHKTSDYINLIRDIFKRNLVIRLGSLHGAMIGTIYRSREFGEDIYISGEIYRFIKLDANEPWFNASTREPATDDEIEKINIPQHLLPHLQIIPFIFNASRHRLWYVAKDQKSSLGVSTATKLLKEMFEDSTRYLDLSEVSVTPIPESTSVDKILHMPGLEYLRIELVRPNPDHGNSGEARWLRRLEQQSITKAKLELFHAKNSIVKPDAETREMAEVAANNGTVYGRGRTADGLPLEDSTTNRPMLQHELVNSDIETTMDVLWRSVL